MAADLGAGALAPISEPGPVARIINGQSTNDYDAVGVVNNGCTGTLISNTHVLTAAHCTVGVGDRQGTFDVGGQSYSTTDIINHPQYNDNQFDVGYDIAIMELSRPVNGIDPHEINRTTPEVGQMLTLVGFGEGGNGNNGGQGDFGNKRVGTTPIDEVTNLHISWNFDNNSESNTAPGDSGGPAFLNVDGQFVVAGVTSGGSNGDSSLGDFSFDTRVDAFADWIDGIVGTAPEPNPGPTPDPDPMPDPNPDPNPDPIFDDHGDDWVTATAIVLDTHDGAFLTGDLEEAGDRDVFEISLTSRTTLDLSLSSIDGTLDTLLNVYDEAGNLVDTNDDSEGTLNSVLSLELSAGTYYVSAESYDNAGSGEYALDVQATSLDTDPGGVFDAEEIDIQGSDRVILRDEIDAPFATDMYGFTADHDGRMIITVRGGRSGQVDPTLTVYDEAGDEVAFNDDWQGLSSRVVLNVRAGEEYYVEVGGYAESTGRYALVLVPREVSRSRVAEADSMPSAERTRPHDSVGTHNAAVSNRFDQTRWHSQPSSQPSRIPVITPGDFARFADMALRNLDWI